MAVYVLLLTVLFCVTYVRTAGLKEEFSWTRMTFQWPENQLSSRAAYKYVDIHFYFFKKILIHYTYTNLNIYLLFLF